MKKSRFDLSHVEKIRRSIYVFLRDEMERRLLNIAFIDPYEECRSRGVHYPVVDPTELRPKKKEFAKEDHQAKPFFIIFLEENLGPTHQKYIRFDESNRIRKDNISLVPDIRLHSSLNSAVRFFERETFFEFLEPLLDVDYCLLIQRDARYKRHNRYALTHFHVKIDWPIADAAEDLAKELRYISKNLYEKGEKYADTLQQKLFEYYGCHHQSTGGRRTGALIAAQYMKKINGLATVYVSSSEARTLTRYSEKGVGRYAIIRIDKEHIENIIKTNTISMENFHQGYVLGKTKDRMDVLLFVTYKHTEISQPPADGKLRILRPDYSWLAVDKELILPLPRAIGLRPLEVKCVYKS